MGRILSIEDDADFQQLISHALQSHGWEIHYAFTGKEGYEKALSLNPDVILLDMMLPIYNGLEVAQKLKKQKATKDIPIIVMTAYPADINFFESALKSIGVVAYLRKPVDVKELTALIRRLLSGKDGRRAPAVWERGSVRIVPDCRAVWINGQLVANLPPKRFEVLFLLMQESEVSWETLLHKIWGDTGTKNDLEKTVQRLRQDLGAEAYRLKTTRAGYRFTA